VQLLREIQRHLVDACDDGALVTKQHEILKRLRLSDSPLGAQPAFVAILGGEKDLKRTGQHPCFRRRDGAWFTFTITVCRRGRGPLDLHAYDFELCFPEARDRDARFPRFVRFDLNPPGHDNEGRALRCHMHPGHDDLIVPAPLMTPLEILDLFVSGELKIPDRPRQA
jgi:hypothetical protein